MWPHNAAVWLVLGLALVASRVRARVRVRGYGHGSGTDGWSSTTNNQPTFALMWSPCDRRTCRGVCALRRAPKFRSYHGSCGEVRVCSIWPACVRIHCVCVCVCRCMHVLRYMRKFGNHPPHAQSPKKRTTDMRTNAPAVVVSVLVLLGLLVSRDDAESIAACVASWTQAVSWCRRGRN